MKATNIERAMQNQMQVWETEKGSLEMKSEKLKQILLESKKKTPTLINEELVNVADSMASTMKVCSENNYWIKNARDYF